MSRTNRLHIIVFLILATSVIFGSCSLFDGDAPQAMFIEIPSVSVDTDAGQGEPTHKITDVWVNVNGIGVGAYPLPARVPVIIDDISELTLTVFPGIRNNGSTSSPFIYALMAAEQYDVDPVAGETVVIRPEFKYSDNAIFDFAESFEGTNIFTYKGVNNTDGGCLEPSSETSASGLNSGKISLNQAIPIVEVGTAFTFSGEENGGADSYVEIDYKNDIPFFVGIYTTRGNSVQPVYDVIITEQEDWNKIYIDFTLQLSDPNITEYRVVILASIENLGVQQGTVYIDNVKFVHF